MRNVDSDKVYIRLNPSDSIEFKRTILEILINLIQSQIISKRFDEIRKVEVKNVRQLKSFIEGMNTDLNQISEALPKRATKAENEWDERLKVRKKIDVSEIKSKEKGEFEEERGIKEFRIPKTASKEKKYQMELEHIKSMLERLR